MTTGWDHEDWMDLGTPSTLGPGPSTVISEFWDRLDSLCAETLLKFMKEFSILKISTYFFKCKLKKNLTLVDWLRDYS